MIFLHDIIRETRENYIHIRNRPYSMAVQALISFTILNNFQDERAGAEDLVT